LVSIRGAREDYGLVVKDADTLDVDLEATATLRGRKVAAAA
jgi:hypothetical protein